MIEIVFFSKRGDYRNITKMARMAKEALYNIKNTPNADKGFSKMEIERGAVSKYKILNANFVNIDLEDEGGINLYTGFAPPHLDYTKSISIPVYGDYESYSLYDPDFSPWIFSTYETYPEYHFLPIPDLDFVADIDHPKVWARVYAYDFATEGPIRHNDKIKFDMDLFNFSDDTYAVFQIIGTYALDNIRLPYLDNSNNRLIRNLIYIQDTAINSSECLPALNILSIEEIGLLEVSQKNKDDYELLVYAGEDRPPAMQKKNLTITVSFPSLTNINDSNRVFISRFGTINNLYYFFYTVFVKADTMDDGREKLEDLANTLYTKESPNSNDGSKTDKKEADSIDLLGIYYRPNYFEVGDDFIFMRNTDSPYTIGGVIPFMPAFGSDYYVPESYAESTPKQWLGEDLSDYITEETIDKMPAMMYYDLEDKKPRDIEGFGEDFHFKLSYITNGFLSIPLSQDGEFILYLFNTIPAIGGVLPKEFRWLFDRIILADSNLNIYPNEPPYIRWNLTIRPGRGLSVLRGGSECLAFAKEENPDWVLVSNVSVSCHPCTYDSNEGCIINGCFLGCFGSVTCCSVFCEGHVGFGSLIRYYDVTHDFDVSPHFPEDAEPFIRCGRYYKCEDYCYEVAPGVIYCTRRCNMVWECNPLGGIEGNIEETKYNMSAVDIDPEDETRAKPVACEVIPYRPKLGWSEDEDCFYLPFNYTNDKYHPAIGYISPAVWISPYKNPFRYAAYKESFGTIF